MAKTLKIFLVDSDVFSLNLSEQYIRNLAYTDVMTFDNGTACLDHLANKPDVIFLDHAMDAATGFCLLKAIKRHDPNIYVVMLSTPENLDTAADSLRHGAFDYLMKGEHESEKIGKTLQRIVDVQQIIKKSKPSFLKF